MLRDNALSMVQCKVMKHLTLLEGRKFDDPDIVDDIEFLNEKLKANIQDLRCVSLYVNRAKQTARHLRLSNVICIVMHTSHMSPLKTNDVATENKRT